METDEEAPTTKERGTSSRLARLRAARFLSRKTGGYIAKKLIAPFTKGPSG